MVALQSPWWPKESQMLAPFPLPPCVTELSARPPHSPTAPHSPTSHHPPVHTHTHTNIAQHNRPAISTQLPAGTIALTHSGTRLPFLQFLTHFCSEIYYIIPSYTELHDHNTTCTLTVSKVEYVW